ncbi:MAG: tetratricopeptide repeat protein [Pseudomonadota bacterium]
MRIRFWIGLVGAGLIGSMPAIAREDAFPAGLTAARAGEFESALEHFQAARRSGTDSPALDYNLGVVHFRLGNLDQAREAFLRLTRVSGWRPLAYYNLGLVAERREEAQAAQPHFRRAAELADSAKLRRLAQRKLQPEADGRSAPPRRWRGFASVAAGYDDNVALTNDRVLDAASDEGDVLGEFLTAIRRPVSADGGWSVAAGGYYRAHGAASDFDFGAISAALRWRAADRTGATEGWSWSTSLRTAAQFAGGRSYAQIATHRLELTQRFDSLTLRSRNDLSYVSGSNPYDFVTGWRNRTRLSLIRYGAGARFRLGYQLELNDRRDFAAGDVFLSYSPERHRVFASIRADATERVGLEARAALRASDFRDDNRYLADDGTLVRAPRDQDTVTAGLRADYRLAPGWRLWSEYRYRHSDSPIRRYRYAAHRLLIGLETSF